MAQLCLPKMNTICLFEPSKTARNIVNKVRKSFALPHGV